jgi:hypothetical protein
MRQQMQVKFDHGKWISDHRRHIGSETPGQRLCF